ncbi:GerMN domain-containing protein [Clostridiaceae bacterium 35-E11]
MKNSYRVVLGLMLAIIAILSYSMINSSREEHLRGSQPPIAPIPDKIRYQLKLYFGNPQNNGLTVEDRVIITPEQMEEKAVLKELIKGPRNKTLETYIPSEAEVISVKTVDGICYVNFSNNLLSDDITKERNNALMIWSIVNSLTELDHIYAVQILIEGNKTDILNNVYSLKEPLHRNENLLQQEEPIPIDVYNQFIDYLKEDHYQKAYEMIDTLSKKKFDFVKFKLTMGIYARSLKDYSIHRYQTQKYSDGVILIITFKKDSIPVSVLEDEMIEKWKLIYEDKAWKIVLPS